MSKIIEDRARTSGKWPMDVTCNRCESKLLIELSDLSYDGWKVGGYWFNGTEEIEHCFTFECPACGHAFNKIEDDLIPVGIQDDLIADYNRRKAEGRPIV